MNCKYLTVRQIKLTKYLYCRNPKVKDIITSCVGCKKADYKEYKPLIVKTPLKQSDKPIKKKTTKQRKLEDNRFSVFTNDLDHCIEDKDHKGHIDKHECFEGKNRLKSIKYGLVIPVCRNCHEDEEVIKKWQVIGRQAFIKEHGKELFTKEFQTRKGIKER